MKEESKFRYFKTRRLSLHICIDEDTFSEPRESPQKEDMDTKSS